MEGVEFNSQSSKSTADSKKVLKEVLPKTGLVYSERGALTEVLCKPKIMPLKSAMLEKIQKIEQQQEEEAVMFK